jgi:hypothetical protein
VLSQPSKAGKTFYSRYYFNSNILESKLPAEWNVNQNLRQFTNNVSLEFDSRTLGWHWQPVFKNVTDEQYLTPNLQELDFDQSKLWIRDQITAEWKSTSYADLSYLTKIFADSRKATTFYYSTLNGEGEAELQRRKQEISQFELLATFVPDLRLLDQRLIRDDRDRLYHLGQVKSVKSATSVAELVPRSGLIVNFTSVDYQDNEISREIFIYKGLNGSIKAAYSDYLKRVEAELGYITSNIKITTTDNESPNDTPDTFEDAISPPNANPDSITGTNFRTILMRGTQIKTPLIIQAVSTADGLNEQGLWIKSHDGRIPFLNLIDGSLQVDNIEPQYFGHTYTTYVEFSNGLQNVPISIVLNPQLIIANKYLESGSYFSV